MRRRLDGEAAFKQRDQTTWPTPGPSINRRSGMIRNLCYIVTCVTVLASALSAQAQTYSITGSSATMKSAGSSTLKNIGYIGTYITVPPGGATMKFTVNANGSSGTTPGAHLNVVVADTTFGMRIDSTAKVNYDTGEVTLPAGTYVVRVERDYDNNASSKRSATINKLSVTTLSGGAVKISNTNSSTNALAAANTYINNFRKGNVNLTINGLTPNTPIEIHQTRNAFNFGTNVAGGGVWGYDSYLSPYNADPQRFNYMNHLAAKVPGTYVNYFNTVTTEDAGKWLYHEYGTTQPAAPTMDYVDTILDFAAANDMKVRMHNLMWDFRQQQPAWVSTLIDKAKKGDQNARQQLTNSILNRIDYLVNDRASRYVELDGLNEALLTGKLWSLYGGAGVAYFYNKAMEAAAAAGNSNLRIFTNEYNVFQDGSDSYANWYANKEIKLIRDQGGQLGGIGIQYYVSKHNPARIEQTLQNLSGQGIPIALTEFGVQKNQSAASAAKYLDDTMRLMFGTAEATDFILWGFWKGHIWPEAPNGALWDANWNLTPAGQVWTSLMQQWNTTLDGLTADPNGLLNFSGFYGDYDVVIGDQHYDLTLEKGVSDYVLNYVDPNAPIYDPVLVDLAAAPVPLSPSDEPDAPSGSSTSSLTSSQILTVPEPSSIALGVIGGLGLLCLAARKLRCSDWCGRC
jgi:GH35 family endo-1,4-beta-xylanase